MANQGLPENLEKYRLDWGRIYINRDERKYHVLDKALPGSPKWFVGYNNGEPIISNEVPRLYRPPMVAHEIFEFEKYGDLEVRCFMASQDELKFFTELDSIDKKEKYFRFRIGTFAELIRYMNSNSKSFNPSSIIGAARSIKFFAQKL